MVFDRQIRLQAWSEFLSHIRLYFERQGYIEVTTRCLVPAGAFESSIDTIKVRFNEECHELHTSPELQMKALLATHPFPMYQICPCFRDDPKTPIHDIEFIMLEFYRPNGSYLQLQKEILDLLYLLAPKAPAARSRSISDFVFELTSIKLSDCPETESFRQEVRAKTSITPTSEDTWEDIFFKLMLDVIEPALNSKQPTLLCDYPALVSPLSRKYPNSMFAERFELYWNGMELANGCTEETNLEVLQTRYKLESRLRINRGKSPHPEPMTLWNCAPKLPNCSGVAVGLDRLFHCVVNS